MPTDYAALRAALIEEIDARLAVCNAATKGPWVVEYLNVLDRAGDAVASNGRGGNNREWVEKGNRNMAFIASARTGYPAALEALREALIYCSLPTNRHNEAAERYCAMVRHHDEREIEAIARIFWRDDPARLREFGLEGQ